MAEPTAHRRLTPLGRGIVAGLAITAALTALAVLISTATRFSF